jgi:hypothetical protein
MNNYSEIQYAVKHKPTNKWCLFKNDEIELSVITMELVDFKYCTKMRNNNKLTVFLKSAVYGNTTNYGLYNFLEFELVKVKVSYSIEEENENNS